MKKLLLALLGISCGAALFAAPHPPRPPRPPVPPPPPPPAPPVIAPSTGITTPRGWFDNFEAARAEARRTHRPMLVLFTGSDWCPHCVRLRKHVLDTRGFGHYARERLIIVYLDFPRNVKLQRGLRHQNEALAKHYGVRGFPTTVILSPHGRELGRIVGAPRDYLEQVMHYAK